METDHSLVAVSHHFASIAFDVHSAVFGTFAARYYNAYIVSKDFLSGAPYSGERNELRIYSEATFERLDLELDSLRQSYSDENLTKLEPYQCILNFGDGYSNSKYKAVLVVSTTRNATNSLLNHFEDSGPPSSEVAGTWVCRDRIVGGADRCNVEEVASNAKDWTVFGNRIEYCLGQKIDENCRLQFSLPVMVIVITCNVVKIICMVLVVLGDGSQPLVTVGDAIASFLDEPDPTTKNICLVDKYFFREEGWQARRMA